MNKDLHYSASTHEPKTFWRKLIRVFRNNKPPENEMLEYLREAHDQQQLDGVSLNIMEGAIEVADMKVRDIMIPRPQMVVIKVADDFEHYLPKVIQSGHSRFPVIGENTDEVLGILLAKDLLPLLLNGELQRFRLKDILRPVIVIPESKRLTSLLNEFRTNRNHMAVVVDEYGGISGLVTIEDVLEEIVGEIEDEYDTDEEDSYIRQTEDGRCIVNALTPVDDFNEYFGIEFSDDECDTIGGIVMQELGRLPRINETFEVGGLEFKVLTADKRRIRYLQITR
jgi:magnesium and cobalt transporter